MAAALDSAEITRRIEDSGATKLNLDPARSQPFFLDEIRYWADIVKQAKISL